MRLQLLVKTMEVASCVSYQSKKFREGEWPLNVLIAGEFRIPRLKKRGSESPQVFNPILSIRSLIWRTFRKHVYNDLRPYLCTFEQCDLKMFSSRQDGSATSFSVIVRT